MIAWQVVVYNRVGAVLSHEEFLNSPIKMDEYIQFWATANDCYRMEIRRYTPEDLGRKVT